jgi:myo-inositol-1(or 4)-monophosphatase
MTNEQWLAVFKDIGKRMRAGIGEFLSREGGAVAIGRGAGGDKTFPVDKWAEDIILSALEEVNARGVGFKLVSEELGIRTFGDPRTTILVDPIDGSNNAKNGVPFFATALALLDGDRLSGLRIGYVIILASGVEFWAVRGGGAFKNGA